MDRDKNPENDEDESTETKRTRNFRNSNQNAECEALPVLKSDLSSDEVHIDPEKTEENGINKRGFSESSNPLNTDVDKNRNVHFPKRIKLDVSEYFKAEENDLQSSATAVGITVDGIQKPLLNEFPDDDTCLPNLLSPNCDLSVADEAAPKKHAEKKYMENVVSLGSENVTSLHLEEISVSCTVGDVDTVFKCKVCDQLFSSCSELEKHSETHIKQSQELICHQCSHKAENTSSLHAHIKQTHGQQNIFCCDLCGFQCVEESLLDAHYLGKTHLRRQNLAARGGFVQILTKKSFCRKQYTADTEKIVRTKPRTRKSRSKNADSRELRNTQNKLQLLKESFSKPSGDNELFVEMVPSKNISSENLKSFEEDKAISLEVETNIKGQEKNLGPLGTSEDLLNKSEPTKNDPRTFHSINTGRRLDRKRSERSVLMLNSGFRRRSGSFNLKSQAKKRLSLLGISKKGKNEAHSMYMKHLRTQMKPNDAKSTAKQFETNNDVDSLCVITSATHEFMQIKTKSHHPSSTQFDSLIMKPLSSHQMLCTCTYCGHVSENRNNLELHMKRCHGREVKFHCQTCDYSSFSLGDLDKHLKSNQHPEAGYIFSCQCCSFISVNEVNLRDHMKEEHNLIFSCSHCNLFFLSSKDLAEHETTEQHINLSVQSKSSQSVSNALSLQAKTLNTSESSDNTKASSNKTEKAFQDDVHKLSKLNFGSEIKHSTLNKPQFQCKKCFYKTRSSTVLTRHIKLRHAQDYHFLCKACNLYSLSKEGMEKHIKRSKHLENARKNNIGLRFEECIEKVCIGASDKKDESYISGNGTVEGNVESMQLQASSCFETKMPTNKEQASQITKDGELAFANTPKRGRPKGNISRTCSHCGLLASSITNLTVHIRRKHSHQYSYLCKVCNYYTVTKGDMERHCATKKHKGRVGIETNGKQGADIIVCPEESNLESSRKITSSPVGPLEGSVNNANEPVELGNTVFEKLSVEHGKRVEVEVENILHSLGQQGSGYFPDKKESLPPKSEELIQDVEKSATVTNDNKCVHCEFVAHSSASLELHVKRKHTKEFEYYCMACDYYAVTRREMTRHAATEKHKIKRQSYVSCSSGDEGNVTDSSKKIIALHEEEEHEQDSKELQVNSDQTGYTLDISVSDMAKSRRTEDCPLLDENTNVDISNVICTPDSVEVETREEYDLKEDHSVVETFHQPLAKDKVVKSVERIPSKETSANDSPKMCQNPNQGSLDFNCEIIKENQHALNDVNGSDIHCQKNEEILGENGGKINNQQASTELQDEGHHTESNPSIVLRAAIEQSNLDENNINKVETMHSFEDGKDLQDNESVVVKETLMDSQYENEIILEGDGPQPNTQECEAFETVDIDDKGRSMYNFDQFDSSIVRIKNHQDDDSTEQSEESLITTGVKINELPFKDSIQGIKKKKTEGNSLIESTRIRCDDCGFLADGLSGLNVHIAMKHPSKEKHFHCLLCGKSFYTESNLHQHLASAGHMRNEQASVEELPEGGATFKCVKCTEPFDSEQNLFLHIKGQHEELLREVNKYIVEDTEQINREREENQGNVCKYCGKMCRSSNSMAFLAHIRTHTGSKPFKCKICHFATAQLGDARNHVKRHLGMREYKCHVCGVAFVMKKHLNTHLLGKHGVGTPKERKFTCHLCDRSFTEKWALNNHMKLHTGEKPFKCTWPTCHYSFLTASAMKDHYRTHTGEKSFLCDLCGFAGGTRHALTKHRRQHTGEKPFKCDECNFASTTQSHLTRHKRVHTGEKPYRCPWCDYRSNCAENIRKHILHTGKHEGVKMYNCPKCDYGTNIPVEFRNHLKEQHPDIENPDLAYLHAGIVSKSYECRLKGQGATFVETDSPFTAAALAEGSPVKEKALRSSRRQAQSAEQVQQVIIIQGYNGDFAIDSSVEETAAATLQTLAMAGQVARVVHITEDGQVIATSQNGSHVGSMVPGQILTEQLADGATQVVVVEGSVGNTEVGESVDSDGAVMQQVMKQEILDIAESGAPASDSSSALDALLCAVTELGEAENRTGPQERTRAGHKDLLIQMPSHEASSVPAEPETQEIQMFQEIQESPSDVEPMEVVTQVMRPSTIITSQERAQVAFKKMVQGVLQFAVCDTAAADQLMKEGVTQVIVNQEGTVHMVAREGSQIIMQEAGSHALNMQGERVDLVESEGEISEIIVTEELAQAMAQDSSGNFTEGTTHYIVTELPQGVQDEPGMYSHTVIETADSQELLQAGTALNAEAVAPDGAGEQLTSMVIYTQGGSPTAAFIQSQRESNELQELQEA
ncbi:zinc finger protein 407 [Monodelphis domestica]|uniref:Zinc finger protein 407 n=1 Tax=Monodelphis domestica TaxID=13616 RepID=F7E2N5_MONDO|nr:zinc finger protein 407 [Monodelphis domestica]XP_016287210.1 zinc finger protein 407 [Monodelphis domestica]XP_056679554.1 zinc finger protein 407 [Monodelphis domestica]